MDVRDNLFEDIDKRTDENIHIERKKVEENVK